MESFVAPVKNFLHDVLTALFLATTHNGRVQ